MLVLSRKSNEQIVINDEIVVTVVEIRGDKVRLGIEAPNDIPIHRQEVYAAIMRDSMQSDSMQSDSMQSDGMNENRDNINPVPETNSPAAPDSAGSGELS